MRDFEIRPFLGVSSGVDPRDVQKNRASKALNALYEDGDLRARFGYRNIRAAQASFSATYGMVYCQGYNSSNAEVEEYVTFENLGSGVTAYSRNVTTMAPTAITGATSLSATDWTGFPFNDTQYFINESETYRAVRHTIGDSTSWVQLKPPAAPTTPLTASLKYKSDGSTGSYSQLAFTGVVTTAGHSVAYTGGATATNSGITSDGQARIGHTVSAGVSSFTIDLNAGEAGEPEEQNWTYNDLFAFTIAGVNSSNFPVPFTTFNIDETSVKVSLINGDGSPITLDPSDEVCVRRLGTANCFLVVRLRFSQKTRADWDNVRKIQVSYTVTARSSTATNNCLLMSKWTIGAVWIAPPDNRGIDPTSFLYGYYDSTSGFESGVAGEVDIVNLQLKGQTVFPEVEGLGAYVSLSLTDSADTAVDNYRIYWQDPDPISPNAIYKRLATQADSTDTYLVKSDYDEMHAITQGPDTTSAFAYANLTNGFVYRGGAVWCYAKGTANLRFSRVGEPLRLHLESDLDTDFNRGVDFTLAASASDAPLGGIEAGPSALIAGSNGIYESVGDLPYLMTPPKRLAGSFGAASKFAFARWKDDFGNTGMVFVDRHGTGVYFALPSGSGDPTVEGRVIELTKNVRGDLRTFLLDEQPALGLTDFSTCRVFVDEAQDALFVAMGQRAMKLPRPSQIEDSREWHYIQWNTGSATGTFKYWASSSKRRVRMIRSTGQTDENEWDSAANTFIQGYKRDGGNIMPTGFWRSAAKVGPNRRVTHVGMERDLFQDTARVKIISDRLTQVYKISENKQWAKCSPLQQGDVFFFEVIIPETDDVYRRLFWDESSLHQRKNR